MSFQEECEQFALYGDPYQEHLDSLPVDWDDGYREDAQSDYGDEGEPIGLDSLIANFVKVAVALTPLDNLIANFKELADYVCDDISF